MEKQQFINLVKDGAIRGLDKGILPSLTIAQAILESGWGSTELATKANNLFGIKAFRGWSGNIITLPTWEDYGNGPVFIDAPFRAYSNFGESIEDHMQLLLYDRYAPVRQCNGYKEACIKIRECGYATDPSYSDKLIAIIEDNKLEKYDVKQSAPIIFNGDNTVKELQIALNNQGFTDENGNVLSTDGFAGKHTLAAASKCVVHRHAKGEITRFIQRTLIKFGYNCGSCGADGDFGYNTLIAVQNFQSNRGLSADGIVGKNTWSNLLNL